ncbi:MAG: flagellar regulator YcgR PilZN domain-containing protein [Gallionella sp.]|jgi:c-di-GMP-binding flagellar brake protein YcgR
MEKDIPLKIEILSSDTDDQYRITAPKEIEFILHNIAKGNSRIALYYSDASDFILTTLLAVDASGLWLGQSQKTSENNNLLKSKKLIFVSSHAQVKVQFTADEATAATYQGLPAFFLKLPQSIYRLQRREYFRLTTPVSAPLLCVIPIDEAVEQHEREVTIMDISGGGVGLTCAESDAVLVPGNTYENCKINLLEIGEFVGTIEVKNLVLLSTPSGQTVRRAGCEFKNLDGTSTILLQRYVTMMQRAKIND